MTLRWLLAAVLVLLLAPSCGASGVEGTATEVCGESPSAEDAFTINEIDGEIFSRMKGKSYKDDCTVPLEELRYLKILHYGPDGEVMTGEIVCNVEIAEDLIDIFRNLYAAGYPIESVRLVDDFDADDIRSMEANNTSCFNFRKVAGTTKLSNHALGKAIDINPLYNPYVKKRKGGGISVEPEKGRPYADRAKYFPYKIDQNDLCYKEFIRHGFTWGGSWRSGQDYQHFERK